MTSQPAEPLEMKIELTVIEDLGIKLYTQLPSVMSEIVANSWDAEASWVKITIPEGQIGPQTLISIEDDGTGMTYEELQRLYLRIGRKRREEDGRESTPNLGRSIMGRKGIGKLSVFGVAKIVEVDSAKDNLENSFQMDLDDILRDARKTHTYRPEILEYGKTVRKEHGTTVLLKQLKRSTPIDVEAVRRRLARHFSVIGKGFRVEVNAKDVTPADKFREEDMEYTWEYQKEQIDSAHPMWTVTGWIGTTTTPLDENERGVVVMARGKLIQAPTTFEAKVGEKYSYSYIVGELEADFLDEKEDLIATHRQSIVWESPEGLSLQSWGKGVLRSISTEWSKKRREKKERVIREEPKFKEWLASLTPPENKIADKVIHAITADESLSDDRRKELATYMMESFEQKVFQELVNTLGEDPEDARVIEMFEQWDVIEAREILRLVKGRLENIEHFAKLIKSDARENPDIHTFFKKWPWILDPTWTRWRDEVWYSKLLRESYPDEKLDEPDRRIDFVCIGTGDTINIIELKRPAYRVKGKDLDQLLNYVEFVRERFGNDPERGFSSVAGYLVAGEVATDRETRRKIDLYLPNRMHVRRYDDLLVTAKELHAEFEAKLEEFESKRISKTAAAEVLG